MNKKYHKHHFYSLSETVAGILDPILRKRTGLNMALVEHWPQIAGFDVAEYTMPLKIIWGYRSSQDEIFQPATLVVACEGFSALKLMHETGELIQRINSFFGYVAINRIKIEQKQVDIRVDQLRVKSALNEKDKKRIEKMLDGVENKNLRQSLYELGCCIFSEKK
ncbi:hypothetical protein H704_00383 [Bartonella bacilliformis Peru38]|uniref:DUF721 domain-containing protein n=2 Tax=Bartonella bacilliformis TaxID=774 RepID=A1URY2_BARBK|nr:DciA family protein [Bartonella bacilliformis]ABM45638.1 conserved hypothetical protein [Bartonella bacilliformis KC583]AMG85574.1 DUF721 domain-containing protein [Bartonella bacilliformis]EKS44986.1 hypothetical protein BbINS_01939 [Bartonella bacilliformis INS]EYS90131.1 hypothetical protein X472_00587 [Bartonella bacilliformis San Pedro600-02]KEG20847.1 hypothetical protein H704_00383 [Bartonella bacilliformis Peru38]